MPTGIAPTQVAGAIRHGVECAVQDMDRVRALRA